MPNTYSWIVEQMECVPVEGTMTDVVKVVHWRVNATDGTRNATSYSSVTLSSPNPSDFIEYADLKQTEVISWVKESLGTENVQHIMQGLDSNIQNQINPPIVTPPLPWNN